MIEPGKKIIKIGYDLTKARLRFTENDNYLSGAIESAQKIRARLVNDARKRGVNANEHDFSEGFKLLYQALHAQIQYQAGQPTDYARLGAAAEMIGEAHKKWADILLSYGYRPITLDDFLEFGAGGGR